MLLYADAIVLFCEDIDDLKSVSKIMRAIARIEIKAWNRISIAFILIIGNVGIEHSIINVKIYEKIYFMVEKMTFEKNVLSPWTFSENIFYTSR